MSTASQREPKTFHVPPTLPPASNSKTSALLPCLLLSKRSQILPLLGLPRMHFSHFFHHLAFKIVYIHQMSTHYSLVKIPTGSHVGNSNEIWMLHEDLPNLALGFLSPYTTLAQPTAGASQWPYAYALYLHRCSVACSSTPQRRKIILHSLASIIHPVNVSSRSN